MFCPPTLAARIDRAEGRLCAATAQSAEGLVLAVGGGSAIFAGSDSPTNKMIGVGYDGAVASSAFEEVETQFAARGARLQAEVSTLADPSIHSMLAARGYVPSGFENVLGHPLKDSVLPMPEGMAITPIGRDDFPIFADVLVEAFANPDVGGVGGDEAPPPELLRQWVLVTLSLPGFHGYFARIGGEVAGGAAIRVDDGIAAFCGAGTLPRFRRRGVQTALIRSRLADAAKLGCEVAVVVTQPASRSQQNAQREGFELMYARQLLVKAFGEPSPASVRSVI